MVFVPTPIILELSLSYPLNSRPSVISASFNLPYALITSLKFKALYAIFVKKVLLNHLKLFIDPGLVSFKLNLSDFSVESVINFFST